MTEKDLVPSESLADDPVKMRLEWVVQPDRVGAVPLPVNQVAAIYDPDSEETMVVLGYAPNPLLTGDTAEAKRAELAELDFIPIHVLGQFLVTKRSLRRMVALLQDSIDSQDALDDAANSV